MTKPKIPKEIPKERPERINPGIPVIPEREPDYTPERRETPRPERPERIPAYMPYIMQHYDLSDRHYRRYKRQIY